MADLRIGEERVEYIDIVNDSVGYPDSKSGSNHYEAEQGEYIISYSVVELTKYGESGWDISKTAANSDFITEQKINESLEELSRYAKEHGSDERYKEELEHIRRYFLETFTRIRSSQSRVDVNWRIKHDGTEIDKKGGGLQIGLNLKLVRFFAPGGLDDAKEKMKLMIAQGKDLPIIGKPLNGGRIVVTKDVAAEWETFQLIRVNVDQVAIRSHIGFFSAINGGGGEVIANRPWIREWETWSIEKNDNGSVSLKSSGGYYLTAEGGGGGVVSINRQTKDLWESFFLTNTRNGINLRSASGKYVSVEP